MTMHDHVYHTLPAKATRYHQTVAPASVI
ncbi:hypothetical protein LINGRAPRIM_LOCUS937 [Linum grandiflorum]